MNQSLRNLLLKFAACVGLVALVGTPAFAQLMKPGGSVSPRSVIPTPPANIVAPPVPGQLKQSQILVNRQRPASSSYRSPSLTL